jgi:hypothetical protein
MRPTYLKFKELYEYDGCSSFVADYLAYEPLPLPNEMVHECRMYCGCCGVHIRIRLVAMGHAVELELIFGYLVA